MSENLSPTISVFVENFNQFKTQNQARIASIENEIQKNPDAVSEVLDDYADDLKSVIGAKAANECDDLETSQELAISQAETWVSDNIANGSLTDRIALVLWVEGLKKGKSILRNC